MITFVIVGVILFIVGLVIAQHYELEYTMYRQQWPTDFQESRRWEERKHTIDTASDDALIVMLQKHYDVMSEWQADLDLRFTPSNRVMEPTTNLTRCREYVLSMIREIRGFARFTHDIECAEYAAEHAAEVRSNARQWLFHPHYRELTFVPLQ